MAHIYFVGTAGAGKSTLVGAYDRWCKQHGMTTLTVNLDPGAEELPYQPDIDIREKIKLSNIMADHGLGPNGAQIAAADMIALDVAELQEELSSYRADQVLIDTPGQIELFVFRQAGKHIVESLAPGESTIAYLLDPYLARTPSGFASQLLLGATTFFRFQEPMIPILSKADAVDGDSLDTILTWAKDTEALEQDILNDEPGMERELATQTARLLELLGQHNTLLPISSTSGEGMDELYATVQSAIGGSEDGTPEFDTFLKQGQDNLGQHE